MALPVAGRSRGVGEWVIKGLKVFGIDIAGTITDFVAAHVEGGLVPGPGLYRCTAGAPADWTPVAGALEGSGPVLVFLHGTASSTDGSFGALWEGGPAAHIRTLLEHYHGRVLALQHRTLTESPIQNALAAAETLAKILPKDSELHLVSHSRGGMVGELLARSGRVSGAPFGEDDTKLFADAHQRDVEALEKLNAVLVASRLRVTRFVRVACPARGTTLADGRLDRYFSVLTSIVGQIPGLKGNPIYDGLRALLAGVLKKRTQPDELPGLEAMMPGSALTLMLNRADVQTTADLHVLGGDIEGAGVWSRLEVFATDLFYLDDHDLVVNTPSMFGGIPRASGTVPYWIDTGPEVTHFNYFRRADTAGRLVAALTGSGAPADFHDFSGALSQVTANDYQKRAAAGSQPVVFVLPGIMGSTLRVNGSRVWIDYLSLARGGLARLALKAAGIVPEGLVGDSYAKLVEHLAATHEVIPFPYDWRHSIEDAAQELARAIDAKLDQVEPTNHPVRIVAHSMGGLVVRAMIGLPAGKKVWDRLCRHPGARFIMLGTPNGGSHSIAAMLIGRDSLTKKLALLDLTHSYAELLTVIAAFDGVLDLLPHAGTLDLYDGAAWERLFAQDVPSDRGIFSSSVATSKSAGFAWVRPDGAQLADARRMRDLLRASPIDAARMIYVAGCADETPCDVTIDEGAPAGRRVTVHATERGDGRVPWATGIPSELAGRTYYMDAVHGDLASTEEHFPALDDLLTNGATTKLPQVPPARRSRADETSEWRAPMPSMVPDAEDLVVEALGGSRRRRRAASEPRVRVRVVHGNLSAAESPVVVGHYHKDVLVSAECYLDANLGGRLRDLYRMDLYPGEIDTAAAVLNDPSATDRSHPGAIVVGLGTIGDLTPGSLASTLAHGLVVYGAERVASERRRRQRGDGDGRTTIELPVTVLLVGSGEGGVSLSDALLAILRAVREANARLALPAARDDGDGLAKPTDVPPLIATIDRMDILELFEDRAIQAQKALNRVAASREVQASFQVQELLAEGRDGQVRASAEEVAAWWQRVRITAGRDGAKPGADEALQFEAITTRANAPARLQPTQRRLVERYLSRAKGSTRFDPALGSTLFDMLVPAPFKQFAPERRKLQLLLDEQAARYPWELLQDRYDHGGRPLSVDTGMVRQLLVTEGEQRTRATGDFALVVGNPTIEDSRFPPLPGAEDEAREVGKVLNERGFRAKVVAGADADSDAVLEQLTGQWRVLHIAAHGVLDFKFDETSDALTGVVVGAGVVLTPALFETMTRYVPDLVFINCCHLGDTAAEAGRPPLEYHQFAANVATEFIRLGARAVVAAGWAVDDAAAKTFAATFYRAMLDGFEFGDAVIQARQAAYDGGTNTWGAYQCYGEAGFTLRPGAPAARKERPVAPREAAVLFDNLASRADATTDATAQAAIRGDLEQLLGSFPDAWLRRANVCASLAAVYANLDDFEQAIEFYERAMSAERAAFPLRAVEQLANLLARSAFGSPPTEREKRFTRAEQLLERLLAFGKTAERYAILGSLNKRRAQVVEGAKRDEALAAMARAYASAYAIKVEQKHADAWYPLANQLAAEVALGWAARPLKARGSKDKDLDALLKALKTMAGAVSERSTDFWELALGADYALIAAMRTGTLDAKASGLIANGYLAAQRRGGSAKSMRSVLEHIEFFERMAAGRPRSHALVAPLRRLRESLGAPTSTNGAADQARRPRHGRTSRHSSRRTPRSGDDRHPMH
jgi:hypothetical protein